MHLLVIGNFFGEERFNTQANTNKYNIYMVLKHTIMFKWLTLGVLLCLATSTLAVRVYDENVASVSSIIRSNEELINGTSQDAFSSVEGRSYPLFKQCDPLWAKKVLVHDTICKVGCYLTSLAMGLNSWDIGIILDERMGWANPNPTKRQH